MSQTECSDSKKRILAVDDNAIVLTGISNTLQNDYDVITVNSGIRALKYLELEKPDLILPDIQMEQKNGIETLQEIRGMDDMADIPVIMLTGVEDKDFVLSSARLGIQHIFRPAVDVNQRSDRGVHNKKRHHRRQSGHIFFLSGHTDGNAHGKNNGQIGKDDIARFAHDFENTVKYGSRLHHVQKAIGLQHGLVGKGTADSQQKSCYRENRNREHERSSHILQHTKNFVFHISSPFLYLNIRSMCMRALIKFRCF